MSKSAPSKISALLTLIGVFGVIGVVVFYAITWTGNVNRQAGHQAVQEPELQSPDLQNISDQFDSL